MRGDLVREHTLGISLEVATQQFLQLLQSLQPTPATVTNGVLVVITKLKVWAAFPLAWRGEGSEGQGGVEKKRARHLHGGHVSLTGIGGELNVPEGSIGRCKSCRSVEQEGGDSSHDRGHR